ncbi:cytochrome P450 [Novosphingobium taihuense]|uniref:Cytochrome P450 n=1 Tax=Novosphingobium taihuense TaxID=260085 RepID=A0A7W7EUT8_9SPHN|nr:cytochrome P450 [Novosphingobium taihuense]TWH78867.1 cytochrome P450 [Novosphingobium taihuense]
MNDVEIDGKVIPAGSMVNVVLGSVNRDSCKYDDPDRFDIFRDKTARTMPFASGQHVCVGQHLAPVEMARALNAVLDRLPNLRLDPTKPVPQIRGNLLRVSDHLHVCFDSA